MGPTQERHGDIIVLSSAARTELESNHAMWNDDLRPCTLEEHSWPASKFASLWTGMSLNLPTFALAGGMIGLGMNWWEAVLTVLTGSCIVMGAILLVSHAGTRYGIPYPVFARLWFGTRGAHVPALARALIAAGWFGINCWFGAQALDAILSRTLSPWSGIGWHVGLSFALFWIVNVAIAMRGPQGIGRLAQFAAPTLGLGGIALFIWALHAVGGFGPLFAQPATIHGERFWTVFLPSVIGVIAFWATLALNIPDYTRYARSQKAQIVGQVFSMPFAMAAFSFVGITVASASVILFGQALWNPTDLILKFPTPVVILAGIIVILASVTINVAANVMAPARAFENLAPKHVTFALGALFTGVLSLAMQPWYVMSTLGAFVFGWLGTYGVMLGAFDGIAIADYWLVRRRRLDLAQLYRPQGIYAYAGGLNLRAVLALLIGWGLALVGLFVAPLRFLWNGGWIFSLLGGLIAYRLLMRRDPSVISAAEYETITQEGATPAGSV